MKIGELDDAKTGELRGEAAYGDFKPIHLQPGRLHPVAIAYACPVPSDPVCPPPAYGTRLPLGAQPTRHMMQHAMPLETGLFLGCPWSFERHWHRGCNRRQYGSVALVTRP